MAFARAQSGLLRFGGEGLNLADSSHANNAAVALGLRAIELYKLDWRDSEYKFIINASREETSLKRHKRAIAGKIRSGQWRKTHSVMVQMMPPD